MKYLLLVVIVFVAYSMWRNARLERRDGDRRPPAPGAPQEMVSCELCGLHLPRPDAVRGSDGRFYCGEEHRRRAGR